MKDTDVMMWGKYKGKELANIPGSYFLWLKEQEWFKTSTAPGMKALRAYIEDNMDAFKLEKNK